ncbi:MAG TPA: AraC family transcriptional regulator [Puia sp.]|jgi:AraC-like DNA-binding protein
MLANLLTHVSVLPGKNVETPRPYFLTHEKIECISSMLEAFMQDKKPFLKIGYCIRDLGEELGIPSYQLSAFINQLLGMNFNEYCNSYRVRHCQELMQTGLVDRLNLRGLAKRCGFNNRNTLTTAFKKFTGVTPSDYSRSRNSGKLSLYAI